jgi:hypothetical protein
MNEQTKSILANGTLIIVIGLVIFLAGTWWRLSSQFDLGEAALRKGDFPGAVAGFESTIHMYIPFHPKVEKAAEQLWRVAEGNENVGDLNRALIAYRSLRSSFYSVHWLITPGQEWIARCDKKIAALMPLQRER